MIISPIYAYENERSTVKFKFRLSDYRFTYLISVFIKQQANQAAQRVTKHLIVHATATTIKSQALETRRIPFGRWRAEILKNTHTWWIIFPVRLTREVLRAHEQYVMVSTVADRYGEAQRRRWQETSLGFLETLMQWSYSLESITARKSENQKRSILEDGTYLSLTVKESREMARTLLELVIVQYTQTLVRCRLFNKIFLIKNTICFQNSLKVNERHDLDVFSGVKKCPYKSHVFIRLSTASGRPGTSSSIYRYIPVYGTRKLNSVKQLHNPRYIICFYKIYISHDFTWFP